jgi:hypothetical protein
LGLLTAIRLLLNAFAGGYGRLIQLMLLGLLLAPLPVATRLDVLIQSAEPLFIVNIYPVAWRRIQIQKSRKRLVCELRQSVADWTTITPIHSALL